MRESKLRVGAPGWIIVLAAVLGFARNARADSFVRVSYDVASDQLVVTMRHRGTNPDHRFSLQWGACKAGSAAEVSALVLDSQASDAASTTFEQTTRFDLGAMPCRPAKLTLRTAPRFLYVIQIPAAP